MRPITVEKAMWKDVVGYEGKYKVSDTGQVMSLPRNVNRGVKGVKLTRQRMLSQSGKPYLKVALFLNGERSYRTVHSVVAESFIGSRPEGFHVHHIDGNIHNNKVGNLEYMLWSDHLKTRKMPANERHHNTRLTNKTVRMIREDRERLGLSYAKLGKKYGATTMIVCRIITGKTWNQLV